MDYSQRLFGVAPIWTEEFDALSLRATGQGSLRILLMSDSNLVHIPNLLYLAPFVLKMSLRSLDTRPPPQSLG